MVRAVAGPAPDMCDVAGQADARKALEVAAAGAHHLLLSGPPGAGKTMLAERLPGLLPDLADGEAMEVTAIHSLCALSSAAVQLLRRPPFENPHHTATAAAIIGGGSGLPRPGAASRAHRGVLFLDEAPEYERRVLDALRQPLESGELVIHRSAGTAAYPARFQLVLAANPCPCGKASGKGLDCTCTPMMRRRYLARMSGPLLDRVDIQLQVERVSLADFGQTGCGRRHRYGCRQGPCCQDPPAGEAAAAGPGNQLAGAGPRPSRCPAPGTTHHPDPGPLAGTRRAHRPRL